MKNETFIIGILIIILFLGLLFIPAMILEYKMFIFFGVSLKWLIGQYVALILLICIKLFSAR